MLIHRLLLLSFLSSLTAGCANFFTAKSPAPVYENRSAVYRNMPVEPAAPKSSEEDRGHSTGAVEITPLGETAKPVPIEIKAESLSPEQAKELLTPEQEQEMLALENAQNQVAPLAGQEVIKPGQPPANEAADPLTAPEPPPPPPKPEPVFEPLKSFAPLSPVVGALVLAANQNAEKGNVESATTTIERAIRIEPRNATLYYKLALLRLKESKPKLAEDLAKKSALLASNDTQLKKHSWLLIAKAREMQNNLEGAKEAKAKADKF